VEWNAAWTPDASRGESGLLSGARIHETESLVAEADRLGATAVLIADDGTLAGAILLGTRSTWDQRSRSRIAEHEITYQVMLTGDRRRAAEVIPGKSVFGGGSELLPEQKLDRVRQLMSQAVRGHVGDESTTRPRWLRRTWESPSRSQHITAKQPMSSILAIRWRNFRSC